MPNPWLKLSPPVPPKVDDPELRRYLDQVTEYLRLLRKATEGSELLESLKTQVEDTTVDQTLTYDSTSDKVEWQV